MDKDMRIFQVARNALSVAVVALALALPARAAEQGSYVIPDTGPKDMKTLVDTYFNPAFRALASCSWGTTAPANGPSAAPIVYQCWANTTANPVVFNYYDGASWVKYGSLNTSTHVWTPSYQGTDLGTASTATTGTSGHTLGFLDGINTISALWSFNSGDLAAISPAFTGSPTTPTQTVDDNSTKIASTAYVTAQLSASGDGTPAINGTAALGTSTHAARADHVHPTDTTRSPVASPTFTGTPAAPTAAVDTNTTQLATTAYVIGQAASATPLIDGTAAVGTLTRYARGDHVHPTDTTRSPVASPTFTGTPAAPTAAVDMNTTQIATTAYVIGQASAVGDGTPAMDGTASRGTGTHFARNDHIHPTDTSRAPLASPALTGAPTAPTASPGTNTTQLATTAYADAIAALKANLASPTFTGTPAAPTATSGTNTTQIATTQFVQSAVTSSTTGVASIAGNTGAFTLGNGIDNSTNQIQLTSARRTLPTVQRKLTGTSLTYTTPANVLYIEVLMVGPGGGGSGAGTTSPNGSAGSADSTFGAMTAGKGNGGSGLAGGTGGACSGALGSVVQQVSGGDGEDAVFSSVLHGGKGGTSAFGGNGKAGPLSTAGGAAKANTGSGGGGGGATFSNSGTSGGGGGGAGCHIHTIITSPSATYTYTVGLGGVGGAAGASGNAGGAGADGDISVIEHYGSWLMMAMGGFGLRRRRFAPSNDNSAKVRAIAA
jgi:hypothetical protein